MPRAKKTQEESKESTALTVVSAEEQAYIDSLKPSQGTTSEQVGPNRLVINGVSKDADGVKRTIGAWHIKGTDIYHDGEATFRPVRWAYKIIRYRENAKKEWFPEAYSVYFTDWSQEILDNIGGIACGRLFGRNYTDAQKAAAKEAKLGELYADIFGFVSFDGGEEHPVVYRVRGGTQKKMMDAFKSVPKDKQYSCYNYKLETTQPEGTYWSITVEPDMSKVLPLLPILKYDAVIKEFIAEANRFVISEHRKARGMNAEATVVNAVKAKVSEVVPDSDLDDDLPF